MCHYTYTIAYTCGHDTKPSFVVLCMPKILDKASGKAVVRCPAPGKSSSTTTVKDQQCARCAAKKVTNGVRS